MLNKYKGISKDHQQKWIEDNLKELIKIPDSARAVAPVYVIPDVLSVIAAIITVMKDDPTSFIEDSGRIWNIGKLEDLIQKDRALGICEVPLYQLEEKDWALFKSDKIDAIIDRLKTLNIYQYFFPPPDQVILGLMDRSNSPNQQYEEAIMKLPAMGHPLGSTELISNQTSPLEIIEALHALNLQVEGELTTDGQNIRSTIRYKPREGLITKLLTALKWNINITQNININ